MLNGSGTGTNLNYDVAEVLKAIKLLPVEVKLHLAHVVRNGTGRITSALRFNGNAQKKVLDLENKWKELGL